MQVLLWVVGRFVVDFVYMSPMGSAGFLLPPSDHIVKQASQPPSQVPDIYLPCPALCASLVWHWHPLQSATERYASAGNTAWVFSAADAALSSRYRMSGVCRNFGQSFFFFFFLQEERARAAEMYRMFSIMLPRSSLV